MKAQDIKNRNMFTIDLLKGQGIPPKSGPAGIAIALITAAVPAIIALSLYGLYLHNNVVTKIKQQDIIKLQDKAAELSEDVKMLKKFDKEKFFYKACLSEVETSIGKFYQWSPILVTLVDDMPDSVVLTEFEADRERIKKQFPDKSLSEKDIVDKTAAKMVLQVINDGQGDYGEEIKDFRNRLYASPVLGPKLENIVFSRKVEDNSGRETVFYQVECLFKPEL